MKHKSRIAIIGAGPAGITIASELKNRGYKEIVLFGNPEEAQYKTIKVENMIVDVGTCYIHPGYWNTVYPMIKKTGLHAKYLTPAEIFDSNNQLVTFSKKEKASSLFMTLKFLFFSSKWRLFRNTAFSKKYGISMEAYLNNRGLEKLHHSFVFSLGGIAQGYGFFDEVTAYHLLNWFCYTIFLSPLASKFHKGTAVIEEGYGELFSRLLKEHVLTKKIVKSVHPQIDDLNGKQIVKVATNDGQEYEFDHVIVACPLDKLTSPASSLINPHTKKEMSLFSFCWTSAEPPFFSDRIYYYDLINQKQKNKILTVRRYGNTTSGLYVYWGGGYSSESTDEESLKDEIVKQVNEKIKLKIEKIHYFKKIEYNLRFTEQAITQGIHLQMQQLQGVNHIWYSGGLLSHWDIDSISEFNKKLGLYLEYSEKTPTVWEMIKFKLSWAWYRIQEF
jgi:hypothetical protein